MSTPDSAKAIPREVNVNDPAVHAGSWTDTPSKAPGMRAALLRLLLGRTLASGEDRGRKIGVLEGVPAIGLDALASCAYGPEAALAVLIPLGAAGVRYIWPLAMIIIALLAILYFSYRQTISAYPNGGGSYIVAKENLGTKPSLVAAASLMIDYVLNVAVAISAGVASL